MTVSIFLANEWWALASVIFAVASYPPYIVSMLRGKTRPHVFSWLIWALLNTIAAFAQHAEGAGPGSWAMFFSAFICLTIALIALHSGEKKITRSDSASFIAALATIPLWLATSDPLWSVILIVIIDTVGGYYPTFRKSFSKPRQEDLACYVIANAKHICSLLAVNTVSVTTVLYPGWIVLMNTLFVAFALWRRRALSLRP
jgi:hypothetical protein